MSAFSPAPGMSLCRATINFLEASGGFLQMATYFFAQGCKVIGGCTPALKFLLVLLASDTLPVAFEPGNVALNLRFDLINDLLIELDKYLAKLAHQERVDMNGSQETVSFSSCGFYKRAMKFICRIILVGALLCIH